MKNIWFLNHYAILPNSPGGTRHYDIAKALTERGFSITIFSAGFHYTLFKDLKEDKYNSQGFFIEDIDGICWVWIKTFNYQSNNWKRIVNMLDFARKLKRTGVKPIFKKPDLIIGSIVHPFTALAGIKLKNHFKVPFVFEIRDLWPQTLIDMGVWSSGSLVSKYFYAIERKTVRNSNAIVALSPETKSYIQDKYGFNNVYYIPNGIDYKSFNARYLELKEDESNPTINYVRKLKNEGYFILLFTGSVNISNNINLLIDTAIRLLDRREENIKIVVSGSGQEKGRFDSIIHEKKLNNIEIVDPVPKNFVPVLLSLADGLFLIQGNVKWGSMNKLFDYLASGKPIISAVEALHNIPLAAINSQLNVNQLNTNEIVTKIELLIEMPLEKKLFLKEEALKIIQNEHDIEILAEKYKSLIDSLI